MNEINNIECTNETKEYINKLNELHNNLIENINDKITNYQENNISDPSSIKDKIEEYLNMYKKQKEGIDDIYRNKNKKYINSNKIYVYVYTETIKLYFILLNMMDLFIYNF